MRYRNGSGWNIPKQVKHTPTYILKQNDREIKFQEIDIHVFDEIKAFAKLIRRLKLALRKIIQEIEKVLAALGG